MRSAKVAEETLTKFQRPYVLPARVSPIVLAEYPTAKLGRVRFILGNYGKVPAIHRVTGGKFMMLKTLTKETMQGDNIPGGKQYSNWEAPIIIGPGETVETGEFGIPGGFPLEEYPEGFGRPPPDGPEHLYLFLGTTYEDPVSGVIRTYRSCWKWQHPGTTLIRWGGKEYSYETEET